MALHWIVPARRVVISTERATYSDVLDAWVEQLRDHKDRLLSWYRGLAPQANLDRGFDRAVDRLEAWVEQWTGGSEEHPQIAVAPGEDNQHDEPGFWARLWAGPLRVLCEEQARGSEDEAEPEPAPRQRDRPITTPIVSELDVGGPVVVHLDRDQRIVLNADAQFLPGDVLELPIFRILWLAGIRDFDGASFNGQGSFYDGTAVKDGEGQSPGRAWLHDNIVAMRFQLLFGAARGAFSSFESSFADSATTRKANPVEVEGRTIHARGFIYGGSLGSAWRDGYYLMACNQWGTNNAPTAQSMPLFRSDTLLTTGWACTPCAKLIMVHMTLHEASSAMFGVNENARGPEVRVTSKGERAVPGAWVRRIGHYDHFSHTFQTSGQLQYHAARAGLAPEQATSEAIRELALRRLFGRSAPPVPPAPEGELDDEAFDAAQESTPAPRGEAEIDRMVDAATSRIRGDGPEEEDDDEQDDHDESIRHQPRPTLNLDSLLPGNEEVSLEREQILRYMEGSAFAAVGLSSHEYTWMVVHSHAALLDETPQTIEGQHDRPPQVGPIAAYDPLSGEPYVAEGSDPAMFVMEATGNRHKNPVRDSDLPYALFEVRPFRWHPMDQVWLRREVNRNGDELKLQIGESQLFASRGHVRGKALRSITRVPVDVVRDRHLQRRTFPPSLLARTSARRMARSYAEAGYPSRAVPYPTLAESNDMRDFQPLDVVRQTLQRHVRNLRPIRAFFSEARRRAGRLTDADRERFRQLTGKDFTNEAERMTGILRNAHDRPVRRLSARVRRLRDGLDRHYEPDPGQSRETQTVEQRASLQAALREEDARIAAATRARDRRDRRQRERELVTKVVVLATLRASAPADWVAAGESFALRKWMRLVDQMIEYAGG